MALKSQTPNFTFQLTPATAASIHDVFTAMHVHAQKDKDQNGSNTLLDSCKQSMPFYDALTAYVNKYL